MDFGDLILAGAAGVMLKRSLGKVLAKSQSGGVANDIRGAQSEIANMNIHDTSSLDERVEYMNKMVNHGMRDKVEGPFMWETVRMIMSKKCGDKLCVPERDWMGELDAIYRYVRKNVRYTHDISGIDTFQSPMRTLQVGTGDCDDLSILIANMCRMIGYRVKFRIIQTNKSPEWDHVYCMVGVPPQAPTKWVAMDASVDKHSGWEAPSRIIVKKKDIESK